MKETIFYLEGRGGMYLFHFFVYNLGGLYYISNNIFNHRGVVNTSVLLDDKSNIVGSPTRELRCPIKIHMKDVLPFQEETFNIINDKFQLITDLNTVSDYEIISIYGETCLKNVCDNPKIIYPFLRNLFTERLKYNVIPGKRIYITRKNSESYHGGILKRHMLNENEIIEKFKKYDIQYIYLEDYSIHDKIKLFMESELVISAHSGALTMSLFLNENSKLIEIVKEGTRGFQHCHYIDMCKTLGLNYNRYDDIVEDENGNFILNFDKFEIFLNKII